MRTVTARDATRTRVPSDSSDEELLVRYRDLGDVAAFDALVHRYERELYNYLRQVVGDAHHAEDVFQNTFLQVHLKMRQYDERHAVRPWLYTIATNQAIDFLRRERRHRALWLDAGVAATSEGTGTLMGLLETKAPSPLTVLESKEEQEWLRRTVAALPDELRRLVVLIVFKGERYSDAARLLGIPMGTVKSRMHTAFLKLKGLPRHTLSGRAGRLTVPRGHRELQPVG